MEFIESRAFTRRLFQLLSEAAEQTLEQIQADLQSNPLRGQMVPGLGGIRKARHSDPTRGKGKRGGLRYLYMYLELRQHIHLFYLFNKNEEEDLGREERALLRQMAADLKQEEARPWQKR